MADRNLELALRIRALVQGTDDIDELRRGMDELGDELDRAGDEADQTDKSFRGLKLGVEDVGGALQALAGLAVVQQFVQVNRQAEALRNTLTALTGSSERSAEEIEYLTATSNKLGVAVGDVSDSYIGLATAAKGTNLEGQQTREIFEAVVGAMATMGKSGADAEGALTAIAQMMGKGTITAEELRGQLEERLPGASRALAAALNLSVADLNELVESGSLLSADVLPALARELKKTYGVGDQVNSLSAQLARLQNVIDGTLIALGESGALTAFKEGVVLAATGVTTLSGALQIAGTAIGSFASAIANWDFSGFNDAMDQANQKVRAQVGAVAQYSSIIGPAFAKADDAARGLATSQNQAADSAERVRRSAQAAQPTLAELQFAYQKAAEAAELQASQLDRLASAQTQWGAVQADALKLLGDEIALLQQAQALAEQDAKTKQAQATLAARAAAEAERYLQTLQGQANALPSVIDAAEKDALAKQKEADATSAAATAADLQARAVRASTAVILEQLGAQQASAEDARLQAARLRDEYEQLRASGAGLNELAAKMNEVVRAEDAARAAARGYREERALTAEVLARYRQELDAARQSGEGVTDAQLRYNAALERFQQQQQTVLAQLERRNALLDQSQAADIAATRAAADLAAARGQESEATYLQLKAGEQELAQAQARVTARQQELALLKESLATAEEKAQADRIVTQEEQAQLQTIQDLIAAKQIEIKASEAAVTAKRAEIEASAEARRVKDQEAEATRQQAEAAEKAAAAIRDNAAQIEAAGNLVSGTLAGWTDRLARLSPAARAAFQGFETGAEQAADSLQGLDRALQRTLGEQARALTNTAADGFVRWANQVAAKALDIEASFLTQKRALESTIATLETYASTGERTNTVQQAMIQAGGNLANQFALLDDQDLDRLRAALDSANAKLRDMQQETQDARDRLAELNAELLEAKGLNEKAELLRQQLSYQQQLAEIERQRAEAEQAHNLDLLAILDQQKAKLGELNQLRQQNIQNESRPQTAPAPVARTSSAGGGAPASGGVTVNVTASNARVLDSTFVADLARQLTPVLGGITRRLA